MTKYRFPQDPHAAREQANYDNPLPSREYILSQLEGQKRLVTLSQIANLFNLNEDDLPLFQRRLGAMCRDGQLMQDRRNRYGLISKVDLIRGTVTAHRDGFGFLSHGDGDDLYLSVHEMKKVMHGDTVLAQCMETPSGRQEARIVEVIERALTRVVGQLFFQRGIASVVPDQQRITHDIIIPAEALAGATEGQLVAVEIRQYPGKNQQALGQVVEVIGDYMAPGVETDVAISSHNIPNHWPADLVESLKKLPKQVRKKDCHNRVDLRDKPFVTIDGEDAKDFDDAVLCEPLEQGGWRLFVAIADVGTYVLPATLLDSVAQERGNSVYFPGRVVPMLPEQLSNGLCSLNPQVDRLCMVCELQFKADGSRKQFKFYEAVIHSHARLTYTQVAGILEGSDYEAMSHQAELLPAIYALNALYEQLLERRRQRGAIEFDTTETRIIFGKEKKIERIEPVGRNVAHRIIEEMMLAANVAASDFAIKHELPVLYRNHEPPMAEKLADLREFIKEFGLFLPGGKEPTPKDYAQLLESIAGREDRHLLQMVILRSLSQAHYQPDCLGHFGLGYDAYTHFTSPIRRYPDLLLHRAIKSHLHKEKLELSDKELTALGEHFSVTERRADEASRDVMAWLKCEYMSDKVGEEYSGIITGVTSFGLFVELSDIYVEGLVHVSSLVNDFYHFDSSRQALQGEQGGGCFRLGDAIEVKVVQVNLQARKIDFAWIESDDTFRLNKKDKKKSKKRAKKNSKKKKNNE